jgi:hypothetical protein
LFIPFVIYLWTANLKKLNIYYNESKFHANNNNEFNHFDDE